MSAVFGALRKNMLAPSMEEVTFAKRGFPSGGSAEARHLESIPQHVILGFEFGIELGDRPDSLLRLDMVEREFRGFAYEGATMAFTLLDVMPGRRSDRTREFLDGHGAPHLFLAYIGIGFAMAHLPRVLWSKVLPDLKETTFHPTVSWLAVDGYGFDRAYFDTDRWIHKQYVPKPYPWQGAPEYFGRACDQGIGRALWFMHGANVAGVTGAVNAFAPQRRADLWSGVGLAAAYAGAGDAEQLKTLRDASGEYRPEVAQGAVFAAKARAHADLQTPHTEIAAQVLCDLSVHEANALADQASSGFTAGPAGPVPDYEVWRGRVQEHFR
jgi:enediyne biosynthesis protein E2